MKVYYNYGSGQSLVVENLRKLPHIWRTFLLARLIMCLVDWLSKV